MYKSVAATALLLAAGLYSQAQSKQERAYQEKAEKVKKEIMGENDPAFSRTDIPEEYRNESAVIIAMKYSLNSDHDNRRDVIVTTLHERIKLQDKAALEDYSEFNIQKMKGSRHTSEYKIESFMGIRVIKPDGSEREVNMSDAVNVKDEKHDKKQKIAISDLQVGDILDYYLRINRYPTSKVSNPDPLDFSIGEKYPMLDFVLNARIYEKIGMSWRYLNDSSTGLSRNLVGDDYVYTIHKTDVPKVTDERWLYEQRSLPTLRLAYRGYDERQSVNGVDESAIQEYLTYRVIHAGQMYVGISYLVPEFRSVLKNYKKIKKRADLSKREISELAYYFARYSTLYREHLDYGGAIDVGPRRKGLVPSKHYIANLMRELLKDNGIKSELAATVPRHVGTLQDAVSLDDLEYFIIAQTDDKPMYCYMESMFNYPDELSPYMQGQEAWVVAVSGSSREKANSFRKMTLPVTTAAQNVDAEKVNVTFNPDNMQQLNISKKIEATGYYRYNYVSMMLYEDLLEEESKNVASVTDQKYDLGTNSTGMNRNRFPEYQAAFSKERKEMDETVSESLEGEYSNKPVSVNSYVITEKALQEQTQPLTMNLAFTMDGFVKKAGNNYMLDIGKLIAGQIELSKEEHKRTYDINTQFARIVTYEVKVNIPAGYTLEGAESLNKSVVNSTGQFVSTSKVENGQLIVTIDKRYNHQHEPAAAWEEMMAFMDAAADFTKQKVLIKKG
jgi:hypothetical protein